jgi:hypothetical protein
MQCRKAISYGTMRRILERLPELHLGEGPSDRKRAARERRATRYYPRLKANYAEGLARVLADLETPQTVELDH